MSSHNTRGPRFDPSDGGAELRLDEYFVRYSPARSVNFQIGQFATVVGNWVSRHDSWQNPFINAPLPYENLTGIWDSYAPEDADELLYWGHVGDEYDNGDYSDKYLRNPIIWGPSYASGLAVSGSLGRFDYAAEMKNAALASRPESWSVTQVGFEHPTFNGRAGFRPNEMWNLGFSASAGPYLLSEAAPSLPAGRGLGDYRELVLAQDLSFAWHHLQLGRSLRSAFEVPSHRKNANTSPLPRAKYKNSQLLRAALEQKLSARSAMRITEKNGDDIWASTPPSLSLHKMFAGESAIQHQPANSARKANTSSLVTHRKVLGGKAAHAAGRYSGAVVVMAFDRSERRWSEFGLTISTLHAELFRGHSDRRVAGVASLFVKPRKDWDAVPRSPISVFAPAANPIQLSHRP